MYAWLTLLQRAAHPEGDTPTPKSSSRLSGCLFWGQPPALAQEHFLSGQAGPHVSSGPGHGTYDLCPLLSVAPKFTKLLANVRTHSLADKLAKNARGGGKKALIQ